MRRPAGPNKPRRSRTVSFLAPIWGWVKNQNVARPDPNTPQGAERLVNIFPTATGAELRGGSETYATLGDGTLDVRSFMRYKNGAAEQLFAAIDSAIYDISLIVDGVPPASVVTGLTNGRWSSVQFAATGGVFLIAVNGSDNMRLYDGLDWYPVTADPINQIAYDAGTADFHVGSVVTGGTSGAHGVILAINADGNHGTLALGKIIAGSFVDNEPLTDAAGGAAVTNGVSNVIFLGLTGVATKDLSYVWSHASRLFAIRKNSMSFYYADIDQIGGALTEFPMGGIFPMGGSLLFGATWGLDTGGGLQNQCIFVTTEGEVAVFQGIDPSSAAGWSLVGVYRIGKPLGPKAWFSAGGDVVIATDIGLIPLSQAINRDVAALSPASVSFPIETAWNEAVAIRRFDDWNCIVWPERQMVLTALPTGNGVQPRMYVANARTGRWCEFDNWDGKCLVTFQGRLFFGSTGGQVIEGYVTGLDRGETYTGVYVPLFNDFGTPTNIKIPELAKVMLRGNAKVKVGTSMQYDYQINLPAAPSAMPVDSAALWGVARWGVNKWGTADSKTVQDDLQSVSGSGFAFAPAIQITSGSIARLGTEIIRIDVTYVAGDL